MRNNVIYVDFSKANKTTKENNSIMYKLKKILKKLFNFNKKSSTPANVIIYRKNIS